MNENMRIENKIKKNKMNEILEKLNIEDIIKMVHEFYGDYIDEDAQIRLVTSQIYDIDISNITYMQMLYVIIGCSKIMALKLTNYINYYGEQ